MLVQCPGSSQGFLAPALCQTLDETRHSQQTVFDRGRERFQICIQHVSHNYMYVWTCIYIINPKDGKNPKQVCSRVMVEGSGPCVHSVLFSADMEFSKPVGTG